jgi:hypothetical protein
MAGLPALGYGMTAIPVFPADSTFRLAVAGYTFSKIGG